MLDPTMIVSGVTTSIATNKTLEAVNEHHAKNVEQLLQTLCDTVVEARDFFALHTPLPEEKDLYKVETIYKSGASNPFTPKRDFRKFVRVLSGVSVILNATSILGNFSYTLSPGVWTIFDFPENTSFYVDPGFSGTQVNLWVRYTNDKP